MKVIALVVTRNEADRYLECVLTALTRQVDALVVYDDCSDDDTAGLARRFTDMVAVRQPATTPTFLDHEGRFRQASWAALDELARPCDGDWVLSLDADELLAVTDEWWATIVRCADSMDAVAVDFPIAELFQLDPLATRTDGYWNTIRGKRMFRWRPNAEFPDARMASGSAPTYAKAAGTLIVSASEACIAHLGYAAADDRRIKHDRYAGVPGHSPQHVASILGSPILRAWAGPELAVWRGQKGT